jgi:SAM-dependent methyltransferase
MSINEDFSNRSRVRDVGRWYVTRFIRDIALSLPQGTKVLDAGAGEGVYKKWFSHCQYRSIDLAVGDEKWNYGHLDYVAPLHKMPLSDESFDVVLCTQVLEHLELPHESVQEMFRVLKKGGRLVLTAPMAHVEHQVPYDFFRFTSFGLRSICKRAGFMDVSVVPFGGMMVRWAYEMPRVLRLFPKVSGNNLQVVMRKALWLPPKVVIWLCVRVTQHIFLALDRFDRKRNDPFGWACVAIK